MHTALYGGQTDHGHQPGMRAPAQPALELADCDALMQADRWLAEGADSLTIQPVLTCIDIVTRLRGHTRVPLIAYSTSVEHAGTGTGVATTWLLDGMDAAARLISVEIDRAVQAVARMHLG